MEVFNNLCQATQRILGSCFRSTLNRFASADTIVPDPANPQSFNRYSYGYNNPLKYIDPSGHFTEEAITDYITNSVCGGQSETACTQDTLDQWKSDEEWWNMLLLAEAGDIIFGNSHPVCGALGGTYGCSRNFYAAFQGEGNCGHENLA